MAAITRALLFTSSHGSTSNRGHGPLLHKDSALGWVGQLQVVARGPLIVPAKPTQPPLGASSLRVAGSSGGPPVS